MSDKMFKAKQKPSELILLGENGEELPECAICNRRSSGVPPDYFAGTKEGHLFHYACLKEIVDAGGEAKCPKCDEMIGFQALVKRIEKMESKRLAKEKSQTGRLAWFEASATRNRKSAVQSESPSEGMEMNTTPLDPDGQSRLSNSDHFDQRKETTSEKTTKCCCTIA